VILTGQGVSASRPGLTLQDSRHDLNQGSLLRLGEISERPIDLVIEKYRRNNGKGWGEVAKSLGIKPGSRQFHALKQGHDLNNDTRLVHGKVLSGSYAIGNQEYAGKDDRRDRGKRQK
jgi:hypothetical protein